MFEGLKNLDCSIMGSKTVINFIVEQETKKGDKIGTTVWEILDSYLCQNLERAYKQSPYESKARYLLSLILDMVFGYFEQNNQAIEVGCSKENAYIIIQEQVNKNQGNMQKKHFFAGLEKLINNCFEEKRTLTYFDVISFCFCKMKNGKYNFATTGEILHCANKIFPSLDNFWKEFYPQTNEQENKKENKNSIDAMDQALKFLTGEKKVRGKQRDEEYNPNENKQVLIDNIISALVYADVIRGRADDASGTETILKDISKLRYVLFKETTKTSGTILYVRSFEDLATFYVIKNGLPMTEQKVLLNLLEESCYSSELGGVGLQENIQSVVSAMQGLMRKFDEANFNQWFKNSAIYYAIQERSSQRDSLISQKNKEECCKQVINEYCEKIKNIVLRQLDEMNAYELCKSLTSDFTVKAVNVDKTGTLKNWSFYDLFFATLGKSLFNEKLKMEIQRVNAAIMNQCKNNYEKRAMNEVISVLGTKLNEIAERIVLNNSPNKEENLTRKVTNEIFNYLDTREDLLYYVQKNPWLFCIQNKFSIHNAILKNYPQIYRNEIFYEDEVSVGRFYVEYLGFCNEKKYVNTVHSGHNIDMFVSYELLDNDGETLVFKELFDNDGDFQVLRNRLIVYLIDVERIFNKDEINQVLNGMGFIELSPDLHKFDSCITCLLGSLEDLEEEIFEEYNNGQQVYYY